MCWDGLEETAGMGYLEARSWDRALAFMLIWRIARAEKYALSLIPGYNCLVESKHASKVETIKSKGGSWLGSPSNQRMVPARRMAESMASGSVIFRRTQQTQRTLSAFCFRRASKFRTRTSSPAPFRGALSCWSASPTVFGSSQARLDLRILWASLCFTFLKPRSARRRRMIV